MNRHDGDSSINQQSAAARNHDLEAIRLAALTALANYASVLDWSTEPAWEASRADLNRLLAEAVQEARK